MPITKMKLRMQIQEVKKEINSLLSIFIIFVILVYKQ